MVGWLFVYVILFGICWWNWCGLVFYILLVWRGWGGLGLFWCFCVWLLGFLYSVVLRVCLVWVGWILLSWLLCSCFCFIVGCCGWLCVFILLGICWWLGGCRWLCCWSGCLGVVVGCGFGWLGWLFVWGCC